MRHFLVKKTYETWREQLQKKTPKMMVDGDLSLTNSQIVIKSGDIQRDYQEYWKLGLYMGSMMDSNTRLTNQ